jgi:hypothetical protein
MSDGLIGAARRLVAGTPLEGPARAAAGGVRRILRGDAPPPVAEVPPGSRPQPPPDAAAEVPAPMFAPPGHFYSPVPSAADVAAYVARSAVAPPDELAAIDLRLDAQRALLDQLAPLYAEADFPETQQPDRRYWYENHSFSYGDALMLHLMLRHLRPPRMIEIGSGWSSCMTLDTIEHHLDWSTELTMIEPYPHQLHVLLHDGDLERFRLLDQGVQEVPIEEFRALGAGDVLFIDSTHVSRVGSDVNYEIFEVLPALASGVYVHFHDIFYPFDYPVDWVQEGRGWNEAYVLRAFLEYNDEFEIVLWNDLLHGRHPDRMERDFPLTRRNPGGSIWLRRR